MAPEGSLSNARLLGKLQVKEGRRQFVISGENIQDWFMVDLVHGVKTIAEAIEVYARCMGYEIVVFLDKRLQPQFFPPETRDLFDRTVRRISVDPEATDGKRAKVFTPRPRNPVDEAAVSASSARAQSAAEQAATAALTPEQTLLDHVYRLLNSDCKAMVVFHHPEELLDHGRTANEVKKLKSIIRWCDLPEGHPDNCSLLIVNFSQRPAFNECADALMPRLARTTELIIGPPDFAELRAFLLRAASRYGLSGSPDHLARQFLSPTQTLYNFGQRVASLLRDKPHCKSLDDLFADAELTKNLEQLVMQLNGMVGLTAVKIKVAELVSVAEALMRQRRNGQSVMEGMNFHMFFLGNPGTGKTEVARLIGKMFRALGLCINDDGPSVVEISRGDVISAFNQGDTEEKMRAAINRSLGRVLFIDEIHQFTEDDHGKTALRVLLKCMEDFRDRLVVIMAGYEERLPDLYQVDPGFKSRVNYTLTFPDYSTDDLFRMFIAKCSADGLRLTDDAVNILHVYLESFTRRGGIGNGRGVRNLLEKAKVAHARLARGDIDQPITAEMLPDGLVFRKEKAERILAEINQEFQGLPEVKTFFADLFARRLSLQRKGGKDDMGFENCRFVGNPGTGKTSVARRMGELCHSLGLISEQDKLVVINPMRDLTSAYTGEFSQRVREVFERAEGGVLFIDEAYQLAENDQGKQVVHQIVNIMTEPRFANVLVILAGYPDKMNDLMKVNDGLLRRFPHEVYFSDFSPDELVQIFLAIMAVDNHNVAPANCQAFKAQLRVLLPRKARRTNASGVQAFYRSAKQNQDRRVSADEAPAGTDNAEFLPIDLDLSDKTQTADAILAPINEQFVGMDNLKRHLNELIETISFERVRLEKMGPAARPMNLSQIYHAIFVGNPGTGKTAVVPLVARILKHINVITYDDVISVGAVNLKGSYQGQTKDRVNEKFDQSHGRVLLIEDIFSLLDDDSGRSDSFSVEVLSCIENCITAYEFDDVVVILNVRPQQLGPLFRRRPNWKDYFSGPVEFPDYTPAECRQILERLAVKNGYLIENNDTGEDSIVRLFERLQAQPDFANGRAVRAVFAALQGYVRRRALAPNQNMDQDITTIRMEDVRQVISSGRRF